MEKKLIGRIERIDIPEWNLFNLDAKVDTGAFSSSLHCHHVEIFQKEDVQWVRFNLLDPEHEAYNEFKMELPVSDMRDVKSSNGVSEQRVFVQTDIILFEQKFNIELSLSNRVEMKYPLLLGRKFLQKQFVVDVSRTYLSEKQALKKGKAK